MTKERTLKISLAIVWALVILFLIGFGLKLLSDFILVPEQTVSLYRPQPSSKGQTREIKVCFADETASKLVVEKRSAKLGAGAAADAEALISELIKGPQIAGFFPTIPAETRLLNAYELNKTLVLDFTREIQTNHTGGTTSELLTVYSIVNTVAINIDGIRKVQILVEGKEVETLAGHLDLTKPLSPNLKWLPALPYQATGDIGAEAEREKTDAVNILRDPGSETTGHNPIQLNESV